MLMEVEFELFAVIACGAVVLAVKLFFLGFGLCGLFELQFVEIDSACELIGVFEFVGGE